MNTSNKSNAKAARLIVRQMIKQGVLKEPYAVYGSNKVGTKTIQVAEKQEDGSSLQVAKQITLYSTALDPNCPKGVYHRMKKSGIDKVVSGQA